MSVLNTVMPITAVSASSKMSQYNFEIIDSTFKANGANTMQATVQPESQTNREERTFIPLLCNDHISRPKQGG
jgi:hypothetical protein